MKIWTKTPMSLYYKLKLHPSTFYYNSCVGVFNLNSLKLNIIRIVLNNILILLSNSIQIS